MRGPQLLKDLADRGLLHDSTDQTALAELLNSRSVTLYLGFDPSAGSLHLGNLIGVLMLRRFAEAGHRPLALVGGATGMVGDPSGRSSERNLLTPEVLASNLESLRSQLAKLLDGCDVEVVNNADWTAPVSFIDFLRHVGKHVNVGQMLAKDSVRSRLESEQGISYTEFSYMLMQAFDFCWLYEHRDCRLQVGGSDQWGNITVGVDLIRRRLGGAAHGLTWPLLTRSDGQKFGKTAEGTIWLDAAETLPYDLHQYMLRTDDRDVSRLLFQLTMMPVAEVAEVMTTHANSPERRWAQRRLADEVTKIVHGPAAATQANLAAEALFGSDPLSGAMLKSLTGIVPSVFVDSEVLEAEEPLLELLVISGLCTSRSDARRQLRQGAVSLNRSRVSDAASTALQWIDGRFLLLQRGKKERCIVVLKP